MAGKLIVLPVDGSPTAEAAARFAEDIARSEGETVLVVGVAVTLPTEREGDPSVTDAVAEFMAGCVAEEAAALRAAGITAEETVVKAATPQEGILRVVEERGADLVVMGTHGRTGLARAVIGSVADAVIRRASVPVVLVPLKDEE
jgi:nucleotide-binding universal stress UspA family protein